MRQLRTASLLCATTIFVPSLALAQAQAQDDCDRLLLLVEQDRGAAAIVAVEEARKLQTERNQEACVAAIRRIETQAAQQGGQEGESNQSNIVVQQPAPTVTVDPAAPQITVQQPRPNVLVRQEQPEIIVRQPAPTVTVDIPQPEIILRMPEPQVTVHQAQPEVQVQQAQPQVRVEQPEQPQVQVQEGEQAEVQLAQPEGEANVQFERTGEPRVTYERAEANVMVNQTEGQPTIRIDSMEGGAPADQEDAANLEEQAPQQQAGQQPDQANQQQPTADQGDMQRLRVSDLEGMDVVNARGEQMGEVENIVRSTVDNKQYVVISHGGLLGLGEKRVALSLQGLRMQGDRVLVPRLTDDQIRALPAFDSYDQRFPEVEDNAELQITAVQQSG